MPLKFCKYCSKLLDNPKFNAKRKVCSDKHKTALCRIKKTYELIDEAWFDEKQHMIDFMRHDFPRDEVAQDIYRFIVQEGKWGVKVWKRKSLRKSLHKKKK